MRHDISCRTFKQNRRNRRNSRAVARAGRFSGHGAAGDCAIFLDGECFGARLWISCGLVAGRCGTVERGHLFPAVDGVGEPRLWRAAIHFLSAAVVDAGSNTGLRGSVECRAGSFHCHRPDDGGNLRVCAGAAIFAGKRGAFWRGLLYGESVCAGDRLYAQRFCGATRVRGDAVGGADGAAALRDGRESPAFPAASDGAVCSRVRSGMAIERASGRAGKLQRGAYFWVGSVREKIIAAFVARRGRTGVGVWFGGLLFVARGVRATVGGYRTGSFFGLATCGQFSLHDDKRSRTQRVQWDRFERGGSSPGEDGGRGEWGAASIRVGEKKRGGEE